MWCLSHQVDLHTKSNVTNERALLFMQSKLEVQLIIV